MQRIPHIWFILVIYLFLNSGLAVGGEPSMTINLKSSAFEHFADIPRQYTCEGSDTSPPISWGNIPPNAKSLALIVDDPDAPDPAAPKLTWVHWVLYNMPPTIDGLPENIAAQGLPHGTLEGNNDWRQTGYRGPCPPIGKHRYFFKLYALDTALPDLDTPSKIQLEQAMAGHIIGRAELIGIYQK